MSKKQITFRIEQDIIDAVDEIGILETRDRTNVIEFALMQWIKENHFETWEKHFPDVARIVKERETIKSSQKESATTFLTGE